MQIAYVRDLSTPKYLDHQMGIRKIHIMKRRSDVSDLCKIIQIVQIVYIRDLSTRKELDHQVSGDPKDVDHQMGICIWFVYHDFDCAHVFVSGLSIPNDLDHQMEIWWAVRCVYHEFNRADRIQYIRELFTPQHVDHELELCSIRWV